MLDILSCDSKKPDERSDKMGKTVQDGKATVRIKSDGTVQEAVTCSWLEAAKLKVDDLLEVRDIHYTLYIYII